MTQADRHMKSRFIGRQSAFRSNFPKCKRIVRTAGGRSALVHFDPFGGAAFIPTGHELMT
ncbi:MAG TPA: hypothetical protein VGX95_08870 [Xanthobacteraceae bacterium]|nr:hypothetical protein [Xanthobacteraceae bacterium]